MNSVTTEGKAWDYLCAWDRLEDALSSGDRGRQLAAYVLFYLTWVRLTMGDRLHSKRRGTEQENKLQAVSREAVPGWRQFLAMSQLVAYLGGLGIGLFVHLAMEWCGK